MRNLDHHGGEVSFPGGSVDAGESLCGAALRETCEEIGICGDSVQLAGALDDEISRWGHRVTPFVGIGSDTNFKLQQSEVERIYNIPLSHFIGRDTYWTEKWFRGCESRTVHFFRWQNDIVWGLTALILNKFVYLVSKE
jgi:8-oxo-dGTP pyrophosphatase MutT (NUDIX family)